MAWLDQALAHCPRFLTAAARKRLGRVSVPVWPVILSDRLRIFGLVEPLPHQLPNPTGAHLAPALQGLALHLQRFALHSLCFYAGFNVCWQANDLFHRGTRQILTHYSPVCHLTDLLATILHNPRPRSTCMCQACH